MIQSPPVQTSAHGITCWLMLLFSLPSSIPFALSSFQSDSKLSRAGTTSRVILRNPLYLQSNYNWAQKQQQLGRIDIVFFKAWNRNTERVFTRFLALTFSYHNENIKGKFSEGDYERSTTLLWPDQLHW